MIDYLREANALFDYTQSLRRDFHRHPELGFHETRTAGIVAAQLKKLGMHVREGVGKTGVVGLLDGGQPGPVVLLRFDMDALPVTEQTGAPYASTNPGVMHACGHDGHIAIGLTIAKLLHAHREQLYGSVKFIFQPAEEGPCGEEAGGAYMMMRDGILVDPKPDLAFAMHLWNEKPIGWLHAAAGPVMAGAEQFQISVAGKGGHAAMPHQAVDPVIAAVQIVSALQSIVSRNVAPLQSAVLSVTALHSGESFNIIPPEAHIEGTIRTFESGVREMVLRRLKEITNGVADAMGCTVQVEVKQVTPAVVNDEAAVQRVVNMARQIFPESSLDSSSNLTMGSEDMAFILEKIPGCYFFVGSANAQRGLDYFHHHPKFDFDEAVLPQAAALMAAVVADYLSDYG